MNWLEDLQSLLEDVQGSGVGQAVGNVAGPGADVVMRTLEAPLNAVKFGTGFGIGAINEGLGLLPGQPGYERGTSQAFHQRNPWDAPMAVWDEVRADEPKWFQAPTELLLDPTTYTGLGLAGKGAKTLREAQVLQEAAGHAGLARGLGGLAKGYEAAQFVNDAPGEYLLPPVQKGITNVADKFRSPTGVGTGLLDLSPKSQLKLDIDEINMALNGARSSGVQRVAGKPLPLSNTEFFPHPGLTLEQNSLLSRKLKDGQTYGQFLDGHALTAMKDRDMLIGSGVDWDPGKNSLDDWLAAVKGKPNEAANEKIVRAWHKAGRDLLNFHDPDDLAVVMLEGELRKERGIRESPRSYLGSLLKSAWGEQALASGKYQTGNITSNAIMTMVSGHGDWTLMNPKTYLRNFKIFNAGENTIKRDRLLASTKTYQQAEKWGQDAARVTFSITGGGIQDFNNSPYESAIGTIAGKITKSDKVGNVVGKPFVWNNRFALGVDLVPRDAIYSDVKELVMTEGIRDWESAVTAARPGGAEFKTFGLPDSPPSLEAMPLQRHLESLGINPGKAQRLRQDYVELLGRADKEARAEMGKVQFNYLKTNLDEQVGKYIPFHYWYSRALRFWGEAAVRNPYVMANYMRQARGMEDAEKDPGLSARQKGFIRLMGTPLGHSLLMNPDALFGVVQVFGMDQSNDPNADPNAPWYQPPEGMSEIGGVVSWMKNRGVGLYPWMDGLMNMMGMYGNTFEPDLLGIRHKALVGSAVNWAMANSGAAPPGTPYANAMGQARWALSSTASQFLPGWLARPVAPKAGGSTQQASLDTVIEHIVLTDNPNLTQEQLLEIMVDPESPEYTAAYQKAASAGVVAQLLNFTLPLKFSLRNDAKDVRYAQKGAIEKAATAANMNPFEYAPTVGDIQFMADYKRLTGKDWQPGDYADANFKVDLARAPQESKRFIYEDAAFKELGTPEQRKIFDTFYALQKGDDPRTAGLPPEAADQIARTYLDRSGDSSAVDAIYDLQRSFNEGHPEHAAFENWRKQMKTINQMYGGFDEYRRQAAMQNPNVARYFEEKRDYILRTENLTDPDAIKARMDELTISPGTYQVIMGMTGYRSQSGPIPGSPQFDTALPGMLPPAQPQTPFNPQENWMAQLARFGQSQGVYAPRR